MKKMLLFLSCFLSAGVVNAQSKTENLIEGSKTIAELISVLRNKSTATISKNVVDSCMGKQLADLCFRNSSARDLAVTLFRRIETVYETQPFTVKVLPKKQECLYQLKSGIYKYRIEADSNSVKILISEGELKLQPCDNMKREIKD